MAAAQWERLKTGLGIAEPVPAEPESFPQQLLHQLDEATTLSKTQVSDDTYGECGQSKSTHRVSWLNAEGLWLCDLPWCWITVWIPSKPPVLAVS